MVGVGKKNHRAPLGQFLLEWTTPRVLPFDNSFTQGRKGMNYLPQRILTLLRRVDLRRNPLRAIHRRIAWRLRWKLVPNKLWLVRAHGSFPLLMTRSGAGALIYYQGASEPETANFIKCTLKPGMVFVDVGAHIGEYTILAAELVRPAGCVHAFEPNPPVFKVLMQNIQLNNCHNVAASPHALWHEEGLCEFEATPDPSTSALRALGAKRDSATFFKVYTQTLDRYFAVPRQAKPGLIKIDVEGAELNVLRGSKGLLQQPPLQAPVLIFEYGPLNMERFDYSPQALITFIRELGYLLYTWQNGALVRVENGPVLEANSSTCNLVAAKMPLSVSFS